jgi:rubrerythrin
MQYSIQGLNCEDPDRKDLLMDIGTEELSHLEVVGSLARLHLKPMKFDREKAEADPLIAIAGGGGVNLFNSQGNAWTADYLKITGELDVDLRSNIAAEARAKIVYERLINFCDDAGTKDALQFLMTREITHLVEEGQEVMAEGEKKEDALADLALIGAAQRVEHYEISAYTTTKNLAQQLRHSAVVALLAKSLAEEENADMLLNQIARTLMSVAKMPDAIEQSADA